MGVAASLGKDEGTFPILRQCLKLRKSAALAVIRYYCVLARQNLPLRSVEDLGCRPELEEAGWLPEAQVTSHLTFLCPSTLVEA